MTNITFNTKMRVAWAIFSVLLVGMVLPRLMSPAEPLEVKIVLAAICAVNPGLLIFLVRALRGGKRDWRDQSETGAELSTWGYFWRAYVAYFMQFPVLLIVKLAIPIDLQVNRFSAVQLLLWEIPFVLASTVGVWLLFSRDRRGHARLLVTAIRGY